MTKERKEKNNLWPNMPTYDPHATDDSAHAHNQGFVEGYEKAYAHVLMHTSTAHPKVSLLAYCFNQVHATAARTHTTVICHFS